MSNEKFSLESESEAFLTSSDRTEEGAQYSKSERKTYWLALILSNLFWIIVITVILFRRPYCQEETQCARRLSSYSPALDIISDDSYRLTGMDYDGSPYRGASPESERKWRNLMRIGAIKMTREDLEKAGANVEASIELSTPTGEYYMGYLQYLHEIHCLYKIHQYLWPEYYQGRSTFWNISDYLRRDHIDHCIDFLRQVSLCNADVSVMTFSWYESLSHPVPQANPRQCRDWEAIQSWAEESQMDAPDEPIAKNKDSVILPDPKDAYYLAKDKNLTGVENL